MIFSDFENHVATIDTPTSYLEVGGQTYLIMKIAVPDSSGSSEYEVGIRKTQDNPWIPEAKIHIRPHLTVMGQNASLASELGSDWQYLSRRFDKMQTPRAYYAHILTVLSELRS